MFEYTPDLDLAAEDKMMGEEYSYDAYKGIVLVLLIHMPVVVASLHLSAVYCMGWTHGQAAPVTLGAAVALCASFWANRKRSIAGRVVSEWLARRRERKRGALVLPGHAPGDATRVGVS